MLERLHRLALQGYRRLPRRARRWVVRGITPNYTVGAICVIERADGSVLLARQAYRNRWGLPGGLLQRGETAHDGARREVREEIGIDVELLGEPAVVVEPDPQRIDTVFRARPRSEADAERARASSPEIVEVGWFAPDALPELQEETAAALVALARSAASPQTVALGGVLDHRRPLQAVRDERTG